MKKIFAMSLALILLLALSVPVKANAATYEYIIDNENLFDDSTDMISMAKEIRNKLDFNIHIYSVTDINDADEILNEYIQDATALIIFISKDGEMDWWAGSSVTRVIREVDLEKMFSDVQVKNKQYTKAVNSILYNILVVYTGGTKTKNPNSDTEVNELIRKIKEETWLGINFRYYANWIKNHPVQLIITVVVVVGLIVYNSGRKKDERD